MKFRVCVVVLALAAVAPAPVRQDAMATTEKELMELQARLDQTYADFLSEKADRKALLTTMREIKATLKKRDWAQVSGDPAIVGALRAFSDAMWERANWLEPQGSSTTLAKDHVNWGRLHDQQIALVNLRLAKLEARK